MTKSIPILITWDIDPDLWLPQERRRWAINTAMDICHERAIPATFYLTALPAALYRADMPKLQAQGHEIGCHGLTHGIEENYDQMSPDLQRLYLKLATHYLQAVVGQPLRTFRSPRVKTSAVTQQLLSEYGYLSDSTVCSQRLDVVSSNLINPNWLIAPRRPYHPRHDNAFKVGQLPIWQIPVSAVVLPFISSTMQVVGLEAMKLFFKMLYTEAKLTGKPIVYLAHPTEFIVGQKKKKPSQNWRALLNPQFFTPTYIRAHGFRWRSLLYRTDATIFLEQTRQLLTYMASFPDVSFMTMSDYVKNLTR